MLVCACLCLCAGSLGGSACMYRCLEKHNEKWRGTKLVQALFQPSECVNMYLYAYLCKCESMGRGRGTCVIVCVCL